MIKPIVHSPMLLSKKAVPATQIDLTIGKDLQDTLAAHKHECVGMAANMIGINKAIIIVSLGPVNVVMYNPKILSRRGPYQTTEGCLSLTGQRSCTRYQHIIVNYSDVHMRQQRLSLSGLAAETVQHELDHLKGILI